MKTNLAQSSTLRQEVVKTLKPRDDNTKIKKFIYNIFGLFWVETLFF